MRKSFGELLSEKRGDKDNKAGGGLQEAMQRGVAASEAGDKQAAHVIFQQVAADYPNALEAWVWLGWTSPNIDGAEAAFAQAKWLDPSNEEAALGLRWVASQRESAPAANTQPAPEAQPVQQPAQQIQPLPTQPSVDAERYAQNHSLPDLTPRKSMGPDIEGMMQEGIEAVRTGDKAGAYKLFERLASIQSTNADVWVWMGGTSSSMEEAEHAFRRAYDLDRNNEKAILGLRWVALRRQTMQQAGAMSPAFSMDDAAAPAYMGAPTKDATQRKEGALSKFLKRFTGSRT